MRKHLIITATLVAIAGVVVSTAVAAPPDKVTVSSSFGFADTTTCPGTTIMQWNEERDTIIEFADGVVHIQRHGIATLEANGKTLTSNFSAKIFLDATTVKVVGTVYNIQVPGGGNLLLDAGNVVVDVSTGSPTVLHLAGPHQQFSGDVAGLCAYLATV
jgi:hypothetical protein